MSIFSFLENPIQTERLIIRSLRESDLSDVFEVNGDDEVTRYLPYDAWKNQIDAEDWLSRMLDLVPTGLGRQLVIKTPLNGKVIGTILLFNFDKKRAELEVGYVLGRSSWGKGVMTEALVALIDQIFAEAKVTDLVAHVDSNNIASNALLNKIGFTQESTIKEKSRKTGSSILLNCFRCLADNWSST